MIHSTIRMAISPAKMGDAVGVLNSLAERIGADPGCLGCHVYMDLQEKSVLMLEQLWKSEEELTRHLRSREYQSVLLLMEMAIAQPEVRFEVISHASGFETIELARG